jgi:hypothetical protein
MECNESGENERTRVRISTCAGVFLGVLFAECQTSRAEQDWIVGMCFGLQDHVVVRIAVSGNEPPLSRRE